VFTITAERSSETRKRVGHAPDFANDVRAVTVLNDGAVELAFR
jgi:hypothetical protein